MACGQGAHCAVGRRSMELGGIGVGVMETVSWNRLKLTILYFVGWGFCSTGCGLMRTRHIVSGEFSEGC